jgi:hypothetical protein
MKLNTTSWKDRLEVLAKLTGCLKTLADIIDFIGRHS